MNGVEAMSAITDHPKVLGRSLEPVESGWMALAVDDSGTGLDPAVTDRVVEPLFTTKPYG